MSIITSKFKSDNATKLKQDFIDSNYYVFASSTKITETINSDYSINEYVENALFGKKINPNEVFFMVNNIRWTYGAVYSQYDDRLDLSQENFYAIVYPSDNNTGDYRVYKCISNNHGTQSINAPNYDPDTDNQLYRMGDGYVWKFMYAITPVEYKKYAALRYVPIIYPSTPITNITSNGSLITFTADNDFVPGMVATVRGAEPTQFNITDRAIVSATPSSFTVSGTETGVYVESGAICLIKNVPVNKKSIDHIEVENYNLNTGYELKSGIIEEVGENNITIYDASLSLSEISNYYSGQSFYVISPNNTANLYTIDKYSYNISTKKAIVTLIDKDSFIEKNFNFEIFPKIEIDGDGSGAIGIPKINELGTIESILMLDSGSGYSRAVARVVTPLYGFDTQSSLSVDVEAILRPILSPEKGHGYNIEYELISSRLHVYSEITDTDNLFIPSTNVYTKIGLIKDPTFSSNTAPELFDNRLKITLDSNVLDVGDIVTQNISGKITFSAEVHEVDGNDVYLCNYHGPYQNYNIEGYSDIPIDIARPLIAPQGQIMIINNIVRPEYIQKTGDVYYATNFPPITRTSTSNEEYKIILEF